MRAEQERGELLVVFPGLRCRKAREYLGEDLKWVLSIQLRRDCEAVEHAGSVGTVDRVAKHPVFLADREFPDRPFDPAVIDLVATIGEKGREFWVLRNTEVHRISDRTRFRNLLDPRFDPMLYGFE